MSKLGVSQEPLLPGMSTGGLLGSLPSSSLSFWPTETCSGRPGCWQPSAFISLVGNNKGILAFGILYLKRPPAPTPSVSLSRLCSILSLVAVGFQQGNGFFALGPGPLTMLPLGQGPAGFSCKGPCGKYFSCWSWSERRLRS